MKTALNTISLAESIIFLETLVRTDSTFRQRANGIRNQTMVLLMLDAGLRIGETVSLYRSDLLHMGTPAQNLLVRAETSKSHRERVIPLSIRIQANIILMQETLWSKLIVTTDGWAFYADNPQSHITARTVQRIVEAASFQAFGRTIHPHVLRHTFASRLMRTTNIRIVQQLLGHKSIQSTQIYTHPNHDDLTNAIQSLGD